MHYAGTVGEKWRTRDALIGAYVGRGIVYSVA